MSSLRKNASPLLFSVLLTAAMACSITDVIPGTGSSNASTPKPPLPANPLKVTVALDASATTKGVIPVTGGTLSATAVDGTKFTLTVPEKALLSDQEISMTPVSSIDGLPLSGGLVAAVDLKPDGLVLFQPATLTIEPAKGVSPKEYVSFSYNGSGDELFLYPAEVTDTTVTVSLMHFTGFGGGNGSAASIDSYTPSSGEDQARQKMGAAADDARKSGNGVPPMDDLIAIMREWYNSTVYPNLQSGANDDTVFESALAEFQRWLVTTALLGLPEDTFHTEVERARNRVYEGMNNAIKKSSERCVSQKNPAEATRLIRLAVFSIYAQALGTEPDQYDYAVREAGKCATFELQFTSRIETESGCQSNFISQVKATVTLSVEGNGLNIAVPGLFKGSAPLEYAEFVPPSGCSGEGVVECPAQSTSTTNSTFEVTSASLLNLNVGKGSDPLKPNIWVEYDPGEPAEKMIVQCPGGEPVDAFQWMEEMGFPKVLLWHDAYTASHQEEGGGPFTARDWEYNGGSLYARKVYQGKRGETELGFPFTEDTTMEIFHKPGGG